MIPQPIEPPVHRLSLVRESAGRGAYRTILSNADCAAKWLLDKFADEPAEVMGAVFLDTRNRPISCAVFFRGTINRAAAEPRPILAHGLLVNATGFILFHNHPSGDPSPSVEDLSFTRRLAEAGDVVGVRLVDHLILGHGRHVSLRNRGGW